MLKRVADLSTPEKARLDAKLSDALKRFIEANSFEKIHCYYPQLNEVNFKKYIEELWAKGQEIYLPKVKAKGEMTAHKYEGFQALKQSKWGIWEPQNQAAPPQQYDLIIVPGLAFNANNHRLGYGGGYYDRFLARQESALKLGLAYPFSLNQKFEVEEHDLPLNQILSID